MLLIATSPTIYCDHFSISYRLQVRIKHDSKTEFGPGKLCLEAPIQIIQNRLYVCHYQVPASDSAEEEQGVGVLSD